MNNLSVNIVYFIALMFLTSCGPVKKVERTRTADIKSMVEEKIEKNSNRHFSLEKMKVEIIGDKNFNLNGKLYINPDQFIFITLQYLGFEVARILLTEDSLKYVNRIERKYLFLSYKELDKIIFNKISYSFIQHLLINGLIIPDGVNPKRIIIYMKPEDEYIIFKPAISKGRNLTMYYSSGLYLEKLNYQDNVNMIFLFAEILSKNTRVENINSEIIIQNQKYQINVNTGKIENKTIKMPDVNINNRYSEIKL